MDLAEVYIDLAEIYRQRLTLKIGQALLPIPQRIRLMCAHALLENKERNL